MNLPVLIPAYNPNDTLIGVVTTLIQRGARHIIVVNDGSTQECDHIFKQLELYKECHVLRHAVNLGKGRAIKTGLNYFHLNFDSAPGIVTADADGQHLAEDIIKVAEAFLSNPEKLVIGTRTFGKNIPLRSLIGNIVTKYIFRLTTGLKISDTQSGLRCIPRFAVPEFIRMDGEQYEYEMNMLISTKRQSLDVMEVAIHTLYIDENKSSHFNPIIDSMKIYFLLLRFSFSSVFASVIDFILFALAYKLSNNILTSIVSARLISGNVNFFVNKNVVFHSSENMASAIIKYYALVVIMGSVAFIAIRALSNIGINVLLAKVITETVLFIASFSIQRDFIFAKQKTAR
jgi:glycosyltransferase involved in cell wall biosynthesis